MQKAKTPPNSEVPRHLQTLLYPLTSLCRSWIAGGPARVRMSSLKSLVFTVGRERSSKAGLGVSPLRVAVLGGCQCRPAPLCPFELRPWGEHCCSVSSPLSGFYPFKGNLATKPSVEHQLCWTSCCSGCPEPG